MLMAMSDVTQALQAIEAGDAQAADQLLPLVYTELRRLAAVQMAREKPGQTLNPTALVHEVYLRLVDKPHHESFANQRHFFAAAANAMHHILVEIARRKKRQKRGGDRKQVDLSDSMVATGQTESEIGAVVEAIEDLAQRDPESAELVKLHFFAGLTIDKAAEALGISPRSAYRSWAFARAWLYKRLGGTARRS
jgi:RNA polymerase sigma factor (TIGR02999 family)